jgi:hypothetical protein
VEYGYLLCIIVMRLLLFEEIKRMFFYDVHMPTSCYVIMPATLTSDIMSHGMAPMPKEKAMM